MTAANRRHREIVRRNNSLWDLTAVREWLAQMDARNAPRRVVRLSETDAFCVSVADRERLP
jgi:hypothetical protein